MVLLLRKILFNPTLLSNTNNGSMKYFETFGCLALIRLQSSKSLSKPENAQISLSSNDHVNPEFINRNPRNLEKLAFARKRIGWELESPSKKFYHRLHFKTTYKHTLAWLEHSSSKIVVTASTQEWAIRKHLYRNTDVTAAENIGRIMAQRCLEAGISCMNICFSESKMQTEKLGAFIKVLTDGGLTLEEPNTYERLPHWQIENDKLK